MKLWRRILSCLPRRLLSYLTGALARLRLPGPLQPLLNRAFVVAVGVQEQEAAQPIRAYHSLEALFSRSLVAGARPVAGPVVAPVDGVLQTTQTLEHGQLVQAKGLLYGVSELLGLPAGSAQVQDLEQGWGGVFYLSPADYHRVHSPVAGHLVQIHHIPGTLWPVNSWGVRSIPGLYVANERLVFEILCKSRQKVYVVMVGALNVGRMHTPYWSGFVANSWQQQWASLGKKEEYDPQGAPLSAGAELGVFTLGSTVIVLAPPEFCQDYPTLKAVGAGRRVRMGQALTTANLT